MVSSENKIKMTRVTSYTFECKYAIMLLMNIFVKHRLPFGRTARTQHKHAPIIALLIAALLVSNVAQSLFLSAQATSIPSTVNSGVNLIVDSFTLTNASGVTKTIFAPGEAIYVRSTIRNNGSINSKSGSKTQFYAHQPQTVAVGSKNSPEISVTHGYFNPTSASNPFIYESRPNGTRVAQFTSTKSFSQTKPGTYVARVFADANNLQGEPNETDNQRTVTYTISTPTPTPTPPANPSPVSGYNQVKLVPESFKLINAAGQVKTSFAPNEPIYVQITIGNRGTHQGAEGIMTQIYKHSPQPAALGTKDSPEFALIHGPFGVTPANTTNWYQSTPGQSHHRFYGSTRYFTQSKPGTYTARIFVDAMGREPRDNKADNQRTVTYTITGSPTTPPPTNPNPWPPTTVWPQPVQDRTGLLAIVNKKFKLPSDYVPANLRTVKIPLINNQPLRNDAATALEQMNNDALKKGIRMHLRSGYRSYWTQNTLYNNYVAQYGRASADTFSARPGHSEHQTGLAFDLGDRDAPGCDLAACFANTKSGKYVAQNAHRFGFIIRYPNGKTGITGYTYEPWHLRYVGVSAATNIYNSGKTMEEYFNVPGGGY